MISLGSWGFDFDSRGLVLRFLFYFLIVADDCLWALLDSYLATCGFGFDLIFCVGLFARLL